MMKSRAKAVPVQPRDRRNREAELIPAALKIFAEKGYAASSIQDVADAVGVLKGSLYHYIDSKEDLLFQIFEDAHVDAEELMREVDLLDVDAIERLRIYLERSVRTTMSHLELTTLYFRDWRYLTGDRRDKLVERRRGYDQYLRKLITACYEQAGIVSPIDTRYVSSFVIGGTNWVADWYRRDNDESADDLAIGYANLAMAAILGAPRVRSTLATAKEEPPARVTKRAGSSSKAS
jgi:AcrR family transcriptional regulator